MAGKIIQFFKLFAYLPENPVIIDQLIMKINRGGGGGNSQKRKIGNS